MMRQFLQSRRPLAVGALCMTVLFMYSGCAPLKKKFIRQKKKDKAALSDFVPVLEPEVYPVKTMGPADIYGQKYALLKVWISDFADNYATIKNDKRMVGDLESALKAIEEMLAQVVSPVSDGLSTLKNQIVWVHDEFVKPASFRNVSKINSELREIERTINKEFKPKAVSEHFRVQ
ncbi:MAG: hypothetical protein JNN05_08170 [Candidatus Omnitrophica bacterium]|nr:hypothetical protein [Candidatus Omnitrophota bacterium]